MDNLEEFELTPAQSTWEGLEFSPRNAFHAGTIRDDPGAYQDDRVLIKISSRPMAILLNSEICAWLRESENFVPKDLVEPIDRVMAETELILIEYVVSISSSHDYISKLTFWINYGEKPPVQIRGFFPDTQFENVGGAGFSFGTDISLLGEAQSALQTSDVIPQKWVELSANGDLSMKMGGKLEFKTDVTFIKSVVVATGLNDYEGGWEIKRTTKPLLGSLKFYHLVNRLPNFGFPLTAKAKVKVTVDKLLGLYQSTREVKEIGLTIEPGSLADTKPESNSALPKLV